MSELSSAIRAVCEEKGLSYESVIETIETALAAAYRKDFGQKNQNIKVEFNPDTGESKIFDVKTVVADLPEDYFDEEGKVSEKYRPKKAEGEEDFPVGTENSEEYSEEDDDLIKFNPKTEIQYKDATMIKSDVYLGEELVAELAAPKEYDEWPPKPPNRLLFRNCAKLKEKWF
jgi:N utilization substance protein A